MNDALDEDRQPSVSSPERDRLRPRDILLAAFIGFSKALGWEETMPSEQIVALSPDLNSGGLDLTFDDLDPLD